MTPSHRDLECQLFHPMLEFCCHFMLCDELFGAGMAAPAALTAALPGARLHPPHARRVTRRKGLARVSSLRAGKERQRTLPPMHPTFKDLDWKPNLVLPTPHLPGPWWPLCQRHGKCKWTFPHRHPWRNQNRVVRKKGQMTLGRKCWVSGVFGGRISRFLWIEMENWGQGNNRMGP